MAILRYLTYTRSPKTIITTPTGFYLVTASLGVDSSLCSIALETKPQHSRDHNFCIPTSRCCSLSGFHRCIWKGPMRTSDSMFSDALAVISLFEPRLSLLDPCASQSIHGHIVRRIEKVPLWYGIEALSMPFAQTTDSKYHIKCEYVHRLLLNQPFE